MEVAQWENCSMNSMLASTLIIWPFSVINTRSAKSPNLMYLLSEMFLTLLCLFFFQESCVHVAGAMNAATDA